MDIWTHRLEGGNRFLEEMFDGSEKNLSQCKQDVNNKFDIINLNEQIMGVLIKNNQYLVLMYYKILISCKKYQFDAIY